MITLITYVSFLAGGIAMGAAIYLTLIKIQWI
jgi:hypothetical protein